jgi:glycerol-3-phosphate acyltransferase PlsX
MRIALDVHGGDIGLSRNLAAAIEVSESTEIRLTLVGDAREIEMELRRLGGDPSRFDIVHASERIAMDESAVQSVRRKTDNSITVSLDLHRRGQVDGVVSAGHSGAVVAGSLMTLGRIPGVSRPALGSRIPTLGSRAFVLDIGAVTDPRPDVLLQFGYLGTAYSQVVLGVATPTVALLSNGEEASKGNALVKAARELFEHSTLNFVGYVEGHDLLKQPPSVTVTDGFTGNVALKTAEGTAGYVARMLKRELTSSTRNKLLALLLRPALQRMREDMDFDGIGGVPLLGVNGVVVVAHGGSSQRAMVSAIENAARAAKNDLPQRLRQSLPTSDPTAASELDLVSAS